MNTIFVRLPLLVAALLLFACAEERIAPPGEFEMTYPGENATGIPLKPTLSWSAAEDADTYVLTLALDAGLTREAIVIDDIRETSYALESSLRPGYRYYWKVVAFTDGKSTVAKNAGRSFRVVSDPVVPSPSVSKYFVATTGEDNPDRGSLQKPFASAAYAASRVPPDEGDTIIMAAGIFKEYEPVALPTGVNLIGAGEDKTILSSAGVKVAGDIDTRSPDYHLWYDGALVQLVSPHLLIPRNEKSASYPPAQGNQVVSHLSIDGQNKSLKAGIWVENRNAVEISHVSCQNTALRGIVVAAGLKEWYTYPQHYLTDIKLHHIRLTNCARDLADQSTGNLNIAQLKGAEISEIRITENSGYGIKFIYDGYFQDLNLHDCEIEVNESDARWGEDIAIELWNLGPGNQIRNIRCNTWISIVNHPGVFDADDIVQMKISNAIIKDKDGISNKEAIEVAAPGVEVANCFFQDKGIGIAVWDMGRRNILIRNNIFYNTQYKDNWADGAAIYIDNSHPWTYENIRIFNNVFERHRTSIRTKGLRIKDVTIKNNVFLFSDEYEVNSSAETTSFSHNLKHFGSQPGWKLAGVAASENNLLGTPGFEFAGARELTYYKPAASTSAVVDKGTYVGFPFEGSAPDIGCIEFE